MVEQVQEWNFKSRGGLSVHITSPAPREIWNGIIEKDPLAVVPQSPQWMDAICSMHRYTDASRLYEFSNGRKQVLPMARKTHRPMRWAYQASMPPAWGIGGLTGSDPATPEEIEVILEELRREKAISSSIRPNPLAGSAWRAARLDRVWIELRCAHILEMGGCFDNVWSKKFSHQARGSVRKAERCGLVVECDTTGRLIPVYYDLMMCSVDRWALQQHEPCFLTRLRARLRDPYKKFQCVAATLGNTLHTWVAWLNGKPAAALLVLQGTNVYCFKSAMNKELAGPTHANELLHRMAIEEGCRSGCRYYHLGESGRSTSLAQFKQRFGAVPYEYEEYYTERFPVTPVDRRLRDVVKQVIGFKDPD